MLFRSDNFDDVVCKHVGLLKKNGILLLGVPNLTGVYHWFLRNLSPEHDKTHNLKVMDLRSWQTFEKKGNLESVYKGYIGGFEPLIMKKLDRKTPFNRVLYFIVKVLMVFFSLKKTLLRKINSKYWSGYIIGIYRKKEVS